MKLAIPALVLIAVLSTYGSVGASRLGPVQKLNFSLGGIGELHFQRSHSRKTPGVCNGLMTRSCMDLYSPALTNGQIHVLSSPNPSCKTDNYFHLLQVVCMPGMSAVLGSSIR